MLIDTLTSISLLIGTLTFDSPMPDNLKKLYSGIKEPHVAQEPQSGHDNNINLFAQIQYHIKF